MSLTNPGPSPHQFGLTAKIIAAVESTLQHFLPESQDEDSQLVGLQYASQALQELSKQLATAATERLNFKEIPCVKEAVSPCNLDTITEMARQEIELLHALQQIRGLAEDIKTDTWEGVVDAIMDNVNELLKKYAPPTESDQTRRIINLDSSRREMVRRHLSTA